MHSARGPVPPSTPSSHPPRASSSHKTRCGSVGGATITNVGKGGENQDTFLASASPSGSKCLAGVFDGHGEKGGRISNFAREVLSRSFFDHQDLHSDPRAALESAYTEAQKQIEKRHFAEAALSGTTAVVAYQHRDQLIVANVGDSRAVLGRADKRGSVDAVDLSCDHKPCRADERARIVAAGGKVDQGCFPMQGSMGRVRWQRAGPARIQDKSGLGGLAVSRTLGDLSMRPFVSSIPEVTERKLDANDKFVVIGSDGIWDQVTSKEAVEIVARHTDATTAANEIAGIARQRWKKQTQGQLCDDITAVVVRLDQGGQSTPSGSAREKRDVSASAAMSRTHDSNFLGNLAARSSSSRPHGERDRVGPTLLPLGEGKGNTHLKPKGEVDDATRPWTNSVGHHRSGNTKLASSALFTKPVPPSVPRTRSSGGRPRRRGLQEALVPA